MNHQHHHVGGIALLAEITTGAGGGVLASALGSVPRGSAAPCRRSSSAPRRPDPPITARRPPDADPRHRAAPHVGARSPRRAAPLAALVAE